MISNPQPITVDDVLFDWALAEAHRWQKTAPDLHARVCAAGDAAAPDDRRGAIVAFAKLENRGYEVDWFRDPANGFQWFAADFKASALGDVVLHKHWGQNFSRDNGWQLPHPRTVRAFATHPDARREFDRSGEKLGDARGRPIYMAFDLAGPWHVIEGSHRTDAMWRAHANGEPAYQNTVPVLLGLSPRVDTWGSFIRG